MKKIVVSLIFLSVCFNLFAQYQVGHRQITYIDPARGNRSIQTEMYYPATTAGDNVAVASGQFPILVFGHGFVMVWSSYDNIWNSLVPLGYIMAFPRTEGNITPNHDEFGKDLAFLVNKLKNENNNSSSPFYQKVDSSSAIMGHSMGGGSSFLACAGNSVPDAMITFAAANTNPSSITAAASVNIPTLVFSGEEDCVAPPADHQIPMYNALASNCKVYISIKEGGHCYFANYNFNCTFGEETCYPGGIPLDRSEQQATTMNFVIPYLDYFLKGNIASWNKFVDSLNTSSKITKINNCPINPATVETHKNTNFFAVYPNPAREIVEISVPEEIHPLKIIITDLAGQLVLTENILNPSKSIAINTSPLKPGMYLIGIQVHDGNTWFQRFVKL